MTTFQEKNFLKRIKSNVMLITLWVVLLFGGMLPNLVVIDLRLRINLNMILKSNFLPYRYKSKTRRQWDTISQRKGEDVQSYIDRFWTSLIEVQGIEKVKERSLKQKFITRPHRAI